MADLLGVTYQMICNYEKRGDIPAPSMLFKLADLLEVDARWLATGDGEPQQNVNIDPKVLRISRSISLLPDEKLEALVTLLGIKL